MASLHMFAKNVETRSAVAAFWLASASALVARTACHVLIVAPAANATNNATTPMTSPRLRCANFRTW